MAKEKTTLKGKGLKKSAAITTKSEVSLQELQLIAESLGYQLQKLPNYQFEYKAKPGDNPDTVKLKKRFLRCLEMAEGIVKLAASIAKIHRSTHYEWCETDEQYKAIVHEITEVSLDMSELALFRARNEGNVQAAIWHLKTKGKKRGYIETLHNVNQSFDDTSVQIYIPDNGRDGFQDVQVIAP